MALDDYRGRAGHRFPARHAALLAPFLEPLRQNEEGGHEQFGTKVQSPALCRTPDTPGVLTWPVNTAQERSCNQRASS
jgi:hypothetical protein